MKKKILFLHHGEGIGGAPISMIKTIKCLDTTIYDAEVLLLKDSIVKQMLLEEGIKVSIAGGNFYTKYYHFFSHIEPAFYKFWEIRYFLQSAILWLLSRYYFSYRLFSSYQFDLLHLNSSVLTDFLAAGAEKGKVVIHIREPMASGYFGFRRIFMRRQIEKHADHVIAISKDNAKRLNLPKKISVVYNFSEINENPISIKSVEGKIALYVGGDSLIKGYLTIVQSLDYLDKDVKIWFCGYYGSEAESKVGSVKRLLYIVRYLMPIQRRLRKARAIMHAHPSSKVLGLRTDIPELFSKSLVLVSPFSVEHFSRPVVEAFANGRCAIATDVEGMDELIDNQINGILVVKNDAKALAASINILCTNLDLNQRLANSGYAKAVDLFSPMNVKKIANIYNELLFKKN